MTIEKDRVEIKVSTDCDCADCPVCHYGYFLENMPEKCTNPDIECEGEPAAAIECYGCQDWDFVREEIDKWLSRTKARTITMDGTNMGWNHWSGSVDCPATSKVVVDNLTINGDYTLTFIILPDRIEVTRYSHDEYGAKFVITRKVRQYTRRTK